MLSDMERSRDGYRGRYRDRHTNGSTNRNNHEDRSIRGNYRGRSSHGNDHNFSQNSPNGGYNYRSSRTSFNSRPVSSRNSSSGHYRHHHNDNYSPSSHLPSSSSSNRSTSGNSSQVNYYDNHSPSSRFDRSSSHREIYPPLISEQSLLSNAPLPSNSLYYSSSSPISQARDRGLPISSTQYMESERNRYMPSINRRDSSPPPVSSYRNERSMDYGARNTNNEIYMRGEYRSVSPPPLAPLPVRADSYSDIYRANDYGTRSERYDMPLNRTNSSSSRDYRNDLYRSSSNVSMPSPPSYLSREQYPVDTPYRSRDYPIPSSRPNYPPSMDHQDNFSRTSRARNHIDYHSSDRDRPSLKRSASRNNDNGSIPSKRPMRR